MGEHKTFTNFSINYAFDWTKKESEACALLNAAYCNHIEDIVAQTILELT